MKLSELFNEANIVTDLGVGAKEEILGAIVRDLDEKGHVSDRERATRDVIEREKVMSTGIGNCVAIPHAYTDGVNRLVAGFFRTREPVDFDAPDGLPVDLVIGLIVPKKIEASHHADIKSLSIMLADQSLRARLRAATSTGELYDVLLAAQSTTAPKIQHSQSR